jgi:hypothetical protein
MMMRTALALALVTISACAPAADAPALTFTKEDRAAADKLVQKKDAEIRKWSIPGIVTFRLGQEKTLPEDAFIYALIKCVHATGFLASPGFVDACVKKIVAADKDFPKWKQRAIRDFWADYVPMQQKNPKPKGKDDLASDFLMYLDVKYTCRADRINRRLSAFVKAEEHWRKVMDDWRKWEEGIAAREQAAREAREKQLLKNFVEFWATKSL